MSENIEPNWALDYYGFMIGIPESLGKRALELGYIEPVMKGKWIRHYKLSPSKDFSEMND